MTTATLKSHGFTIELESDKLGAGFDLIDRNGIAFASEWCAGWTIAQARDSALDYVLTERSRSGRDGYCADVEAELQSS